MRTWARTPNGTLCGGCNAPLDEGDPILNITWNGLKRPLTRCVACAGPAPPGLPAYISRPQQFTKPMTSVGKLTFDYKAKQAGQ